MQNKKRLFIIGAGGLGREIESWLNLIPPDERDWYIAGFLEKDITALKGYPTDLEIVGDENVFDFLDTDLVIIAIANPVIRENVFKNLKKKDINVFTYIAPNAIIGKFSNIEEGSIICPNCIISTNVKIGKVVFINLGTQIGHDVNIGDFSVLNANIDVAGNCKLGTKIFAGSNSMILPGKKIGNNAIIGAGSVVIRNVKANTTVFGNPAKKLTK